MKTQLLPQTDLTVSSVIAGLMRVMDLSDEQIRELVAAARDAGVTYFDHADIYGGSPHAAERRVGSALNWSAAERDGMVVQSKVGIRPGFYDFSAAHILSSVDESLTALQTDRLDVLLLHRPDTLVEPDEVAAAFDELHRSGRVRHFGVSNHTPGQIELLRSVVRQPLVVNQVQLSLTHAPLIASGINANIASEPGSINRDGGILDHARLTGITLQAWSPFQSGTGTGVFLGDRENYPALNDELDRLASDLGSTPLGIATAWISTHPANIQVVTGPTSPARVTEAAAGTDITLSRQQWYSLYRAAGHTLP
ncbi:MAG: aldo/keto reductase [Mycetocola sp.]